VYILQRAHPPADIGTLSARVRTLLADRVHPLYAQLHVLLASSDARAVGIYFKYVYWDHQRGKHLFDKKCIHVFWDISQSNVTFAGT
jgi:hypothetical protein